MGLLTLLLCCLWTGAVLAGAFYTISTDASVQGVMVMDTSGRQAGLTLESSGSGNQRTWMVELENTGASQAAVYFLTQEGDWKRSDITLDLARMFASGSAPAATPVPMPASRWPVESLSGVSVSMYPLPSDERYQSRSGPHRSYHGVGRYKCYKIERLEAFFVEDGYVFVDLTYTMVGRRRLYFQEKNFVSLSGVPSRRLTGYAAKTTAALTPRYGPGRSYDEFPEAAVKANTSLSVFFEENGWVFAEFDTAQLGVVRGWIPVEKVQ